MGGKNRIAGVTAWLVWFILLFWICQPAFAKNGDASDQEQQKRYHADMAFLQNLVISGVGVSVLEKGVEEVNLSVSVIESRLQGINQRMEKLRHNVLATEDRAALLDQRIQESESDPVLDPAIVKEYRQYRELLQKKKHLLLKTYNNASLIIPNSEFISSLVTNWSQRDHYIRRDVHMNYPSGQESTEVKRDR